MSFANLWEWLLGKGIPTSSKVMAKDRLRLVLMHDRADIPALRALLPDLLTLEDWLTRTGWSQLAREPVGVP